MENQERKSSTVSSLLPVMLLSFLAIFVLQYFTSDSTQNSPKESTTPEGDDVPLDNQRTSTSNSNGNIRTKAAKYSSRQNDFRFTKGRNGKKDTIQTEKYYIVLSSRGGRIERFYIKSNPTLLIPEKIIEKSQDLISERYKALEITNGNGMDFQFHLYYSAENAEQLASPPLNGADFRAREIQWNREIGVSEISYSLPLRFRKKRLELKKVYRFYEKENYFRQITILRNLGSKEFDLSFYHGGKVHYGALFYKVFGDIGPIPKVATNLDNSGRFFHYGDQLEKRGNLYEKKGGGCGFPFGCTSLDKGGSYTYYDNAKDTLKFMGGHSRYFLSYTEFLAPQDSPLHLADGFVYKNERDVSGKEAMSAAFIDFRLAARQTGDLHIGGPDTLVTGGKGSSHPIRFRNADEGNRKLVEELQKKRKDALIIDNKVYVGVRSTSSHAFYNQKLMQAAFSLEEPNADAEEAMHFSAYTALFSGISDLIISIMRWLYAYIGNYGWCIILIAILFKLLTFPLQKMQMSGMERMSALRPELEAINKQYANDPKEKQKRVMQLFKTHNYNPAKGCLPVLIQMPIFVGLYSAFSSSVELWHSPFIFWMTDLSLPDTVWILPYINVNLNLLPLLMVVSQIFYQKLTTVVTDSQQKMMLYFMPFIMLIFFWQIPSGVTLYWTVQNFISITWQQVSRLLGKAKKI